MATDDFFRARLDSMIDMRHPLVVLATRMPWAEIEVALAQVPPITDTAGFHAQQAVEKTFKAYLVWRGCEFEKIHDLRTLA